MPSLQPSSLSARRRAPCCRPEFFARSSDEVAADSSGQDTVASGRRWGRLTEVEAYLPEETPLPRGRGLTRRNAAMFGPPGRIYVFLSYGVHWLLNIVCDSEGVGAAVLIRSYRADWSPSCVR